MRKISLRLNLTIVIRVLPATVHMMSGMETPANLEGPPPPSVMGFNGQLGDCSQYRRSSCVTQQMAPLSSAIDSLPYLLHNRAVKAKIVHFLLKA